MSIYNAIRSRVISLLCSEKWQAIRRSVADIKRKLSGRAHIVSVFLELDDPYSYLLAHYLPEFANALNIELHYYLAQSRNDEAYRPHPNMYSVYAVQDCARVAAELGIPFLDKGRAPPVEHRRALVDALAHQSGKASHSSDLLEAISLYWRGDTQGVARRITGTELTGEGDRLLRKNQEKLTALGHYKCGMLHYEGEWFWGIDRLHYLVAWLDQLGLRDESASIARLSSIRQVMQLSLPVALPNAARELPPLEFFYSFRSPYSYLCCQRAFAIADAFGLKLLIRPVLPMVMRGLQVPKAKVIDFARDTSREARRLGIPFGKFADPLGVGVERCLAVFFLAQREGREREFLASAGEAIWARGIDIATDSGLRKVAERAGLSWGETQAAIADSGWRDAVQDNSDSMMDSGSWGVPTLRLGDFVVWGQDRDWLLIRHIEELCDPGDGILI